MNTASPAQDDINTDTTSTTSTTSTTAVELGTGTTAAQGSATPPLPSRTRRACLSRFFRRKRKVLIAHAIADEIADEAPRQKPARKPFIVLCPACDGIGHVLRDGSQVQLTCRLCWERGVVARIVADRYLRGE
jgi:hypothetical protein